MRYVIRASVWIAGLAIILWLAVSIWLRDSKRESSAAGGGPCMLDQKPYSEGALARMDGKIVQCRGGKWVPAQ